MVLGLEIHDYQEKKNVLEFGSMCNKLHGTDLGFDKKNISDILIAYFLLFLVLIIAISNNTLRLLTE